MSLCERIEADLHNHTTCSDGEYSPEALVAAARAKGLRAIGITDHDTIEAVRAALAAGKQQGVEVVPGVEVSVRFTEPTFRGTLHLLLYFSAEQLQDDRFLEQMRQTFEQGRGPALDQARLEAINRIFGPAGEDPRLPAELTREDLLRHGQQITRRHFALALGDLGIKDREQVSQIIGNQSPAYVPSGVPLQVAGELIRSVAVVRVLAHPAAGSFPGESHYKEVLPPWPVVQQLLPRFLEVGLDGLEVCYPGHTEELAQQVDAVREELKLPIAGGGSDCHDATARPLGICGVPYAVVEQIHRRISERARSL